MRAGYDPVYSNIRRPIIPDLPIDLETVRRKKACDQAEADSIRTFKVVSAFATVLGIGIAVALMV